MDPEPCTLHPLHNKNTNTNNSNTQGAKKIIFKACHSGKLELAFTSPDVISTSPKNFLTNRIDFILVIQIPQKTSLARRAR